MNYTPEMALITIERLKVEKATTDALRSSSLGFLGFVFIAALGNLESSSALPTFFWGILVCALLISFSDIFYRSRASHLKRYYRKQLAAKRLSDIDCDFLIAVCHRHPHGGLSLADHYENKPQDLKGLFVLAHQICDENDNLTRQPQRKNNKVIRRELAGQHCAVVDNIATFFKENYPMEATDESS